MSRTLLNFLLDSLLLIAFSVLVWSAVIVRFVFPPAQGSKGWLLWGLSYDQWISVQFAMVAILALGVLLHVMLHWSWVCGLLAARLGRGRKAKLASSAPRSRDRGPSAGDRRRIQGRSPLGAGR
jgi:hypothetical protein